MRRGEEMEMDVVGRGESRSADKVSDLIGQLEALVVRAAAGAENGAPI